MAQCRHDWQSTWMSTLRLPDPNGNYEGTKSWACRLCGAQGHTVGLLNNHQAYAMSPEEWDAITDAERKNDDPAAQAMSRQWRTYELGKRRLPGGRR